MIERAREAAEARALSNLSFEVGDVYNLEFEDDVLRRRLRPPGAPAPQRSDARPHPRCVASCATAVGSRCATRDYGEFTWSPPNEGLTRWMELYHQITRHNDAEADAGRFLAGWVESAGFASLEPSTSEWTYETRRGA